jgi:hypothetical protein
MRNDRSIKVQCRASVLVLGTLSVCTALLAGCGGGSLLAPDESVLTEREQAALKRATELNRSALKKAQAEHAAKGVASR